MKKEILKPVAINFTISIVLGLFIGWVISLLRENAPPFYFGGIVLGGYSLVKSYLKIKCVRKTT